ncbi:MAG: alpha/beta hydrolase [Promethearchaeia archaeon]|nr:MAG: alpha/beta hydrolase [Candidatus Lokiarchaeia archaeon]
MFCQINGIRVYYETYGKGIPVLLLHGFPLDSRIMIGCMEPIFREITGYQRIYLDFPGMGQTEVSRHINSTDDILQFTLDFIDLILPNKEFLLVGESYGGYIASGIAVKRREYIQGLLLICPMLEPDFSKRNLPKRTILERDEKYYCNLSLKLQKEIDSFLVIENERICKRFLQEIPQAMKIANMETLNRIQQKSYGFSWDLFDIPNMFSFPALFICGRQDDVVGYQDALKFSEKFSHITVSILDKAGHYAQVEQQEIFEMLVNEWLKRIRSA